MSKSLIKIQEAVDSIDKLCKLLGVRNIIPLGQIVVECFRNTEKDSGSRQATSQLKALYNEACYYVIGQDIKPSTPKWSKRNKVTKLPIALNQFRPYLSSKEILEVRLTLSYLRVYESLTFEPVPDLTTVISPSNGAEGFRSFSLDYERFLSNSLWGKTLKKLYNKERSRTLERNKLFHYTTKMGVDGSCLGTSGKQSLAINDEYLDILCKIDKSFKTRDLKEVIQQNQEFYRDRDDLVKGKGLVTTSLGRLAFLPDKGGKTRLIAVGNYWIQEVLIGMHDTLYGMLRRLKQDGTYQQTSASDAVCKATLDKKVWSYDLTAATDRFPIQPQQTLLTFLDENLSDWSKVIASIPFDFKGKQYTYSVGQPMGFYSSWAAFALCHHTIIQYCAYKEGFRTFFDYRVLGDDVAIWNKRVAFRYKKILTLLEVTISESKSVVPENQIKPGLSAEFAKRIFYNGKEYSPIPTNICIGAQYTFWSIPQLFEHLSSRQIDVGNIPFSRIKSVYKLHDKQLLDLGRTFHIWSIIRRDLVNPKSVSELIPEFVKFVKYYEVINARFNLLMDKAVCVFESVEDFNADTTRAELEKIFMTQIPEHHCFYRIIMSRLDSLMESVIIFGSNEVTVGPDDDFILVSPDGKPTQIQDLEFLPVFTLKQVMSEMTDRVPRKIRFGKYLASLVAKVKLSASSTVPTLWGPSTGIS